MGLRDFFRRSRQDTSRAPQRRGSSFTLTYHVHDVRETADLILREYGSGRTSRLAEGWTTVPQTPDAVVRSQLQVLRARSRDGMQNYDHAKRFRQLVVSNVLGAKGIGLQAKTTDSDGRPDTLANIALQNAWKEWGRKENCDVEGTLSWRAMQRAALGTVAEDGEAFLRLYRGKSFGPFAFQVQLLDPELLDVTLDRSLSNGNYIRHGIEFNQRHRPVAYWVCDTREDFRQHYIFTYRWGGNHVRVPADSMIHLYVKDKAGLRRGIPWLAVPLMRMNMLQAYEDTAIVNARGGASKMGHYYQEEGGRFAGDASADATNPENAPEIEEFEPGITRKLPVGVKFEGWDPTYPHEQYPAFWKACLRSIAAGCGVSYNLLANDLENVNYSSLREGRLSDEDIWTAIQDWLIEDLCDPVYRSWLQVALLAGAVRVSGGGGRVLGVLRPDREEKYQAVEWWPRIWKWVDPAKEVSGAMDEIDHGVRSKSHYIRSRYGDPSAMLEEIRTEIKSSPAPSTAKSRTTAVDEEEEEDEEE
jgi:lambda family phage portal protein